MNEREIRMHNLGSLAGEPRGVSWRRNL